MRIDEIQILLDQGRIALNQGRFDEAIELIDRVLADDESNEQALNLKGLLLFKQDRYADAVDLFFRLVAKYPEEPTLLMNLGLAYLKSERYEEAIVELNKAAERNPGNPKIHNYLGLAYSGIGRLREAQENFLEGGSKKMADQMLSLMKASSGEPEAEETVEVEVEADSEPVVELSSHDDAIMAAGQGAGSDDGLDAAFGDTFVAVAPSVIEPARPSKPPTVAVDEPPTSWPPVQAPETASPRNTPALATTEVQRAATAAVPTDLLGSAMHMLRDRYEAVLDTADAGIDLQQLTERLQLRRDPDARIDLIRPNLARLAVTASGSVLSRLQHLVALEGDVRAEVKQKRYKGRDIKSRFGSEADPVYALTGVGAAYVEKRDESVFFAIRLSGELLYVVEDVFFALSGDWRWENGRLPGNMGADLHLVQLRGEGALLLSLQKQTKLAAVALKGQKITIPIAHLAGWYGNVVPVLVDAALPGDSAARGAVQFQGDGAVLLTVAAR